MKIFILFIIQIGINSVYSTDLKSYINDLFNFDNEPRVKFDDKVNDEIHYHIHKKISRALFNKIVLLIEFY